jgi:ClpX C4-type zinc finger
VEKLIAGPMVNIYEECVRLCVAILEGAYQGDFPRPPKSHRPPDPLARRPTSAIVSLVAV